MEESSCSQKPGLDSKETQTVLLLCPSEWGGEQTGELTATVSLAGGSQQKQC